MCLAPIIERPTVDFFLFGIEPEQICGSSLDIVDAHAEWVRDAWGAAPERIEYGLFAARAECWPCSDGAAAFGQQGLLGTTRMPDRHEVAHATHGSGCTSLIEEGWAVLHANPFEDNAVVGSLAGAGAAIEANGRLPGEYYPFAARFVAFVIEGWGIGAVHDLCAIQIANEPQFDAAVQGVLGMSLAQTQLALDDYPAWRLGALRQDQACEAASAAPMVPTSAVLDLGCGPSGGEGLLGGPNVTQTLVDFGEGGSFALEFSSADPVELWVELRSCAREGLASIFYEITILHPKPHLPATLVMPSPFPPGPHVVRAMVREPTPDQTIGVSIREWP